MQAVGSVFFAIGLAQENVPIVKRKKTAYWYRKGADCRYTSAINNLGHAYDIGHGVPVSLTLAADYYRRAAERGDAVAMGNLGAMHLSGELEDSSEEIGLEWTWKAAMKGNHRAMVRLANIFFQRDRVDDGMIWIRKAAKKKNKQALYQLGMRTDNPEERMKSLLRAAKKGHAGAMSAIGLSYFLGDRIERSPEKAVYWFLQGKEKGDASSLYNLAYCYEQGIGVPQSKEKAIALYILSAEKNLDVAKNYLRRKICRCASPSDLPFLLTILKNLSLSSVLRTQASRKRFELMENSDFLHFDAAGG